MEQAKFALGLTYCFAYHQRLAIIKHGLISILHIISLLFVVHWRVWDWAFQARLMIACILLHAITAARRCSLSLAKVDLHMPFG